MCPTQQRPILNTLSPFLMWLWIRPDIRFKSWPKSIFAVSVTQVQNTVHWCKLMCWPFEAFLVYNMWIMWLWCLGCRLWLTAPFYLVFGVLVRVDSARSGPEAGTSTNTSAEPKKNILEKFKIAKCLQCKLIVYVSVLLGASILNFFTVSYTFCYCLNIS
jgi:hypothetical protein